VAAGPSGAAWAGGGGPGSAVATGRLRRLTAIESVQALGHLWPLDTVCRHWRSIMAADYPIRTFRQRCHSQGRRRVCYTIR
jgi:hypothetical protein